MVNIYCDVLDDEILEAARIICRAQKTDVKIITSTGTVEVRHEEETSQAEKDINCDQKQTSP